MGLVGHTDEDAMNIDEDEPQITDMVSFMCLAVLYIYITLIYTIIGRNGRRRPQ
jgi:hypothetical protein